MASVGTLAGHAGADDSAATSADDATAGPGDVDAEWGTGDSTREALDVDVAPPPTSDTGCWRMADAQLTTAIGVASASDRATINHRV